MNKINATERAMIHNTLINKYKMTQPLADSENYYETKFGPLNVEVYIADIYAKTGIHHPCKMGIYDADGHELKLLLPDATYKKLFKLLDMYTTINPYI